MNKLYICSSEGLEEVEIYNITDKHVELYKDSLMRFRDTNFFKIDKVEEVIKDTRSQKMTEYYCDGGIEI
ncbi:Uncharacterised protein [Clostridioides difficile]|uniref:hypothetical protein n=1 Tax=Clostridioides difficile TaxID=1496 RepID=UPI00098004F5|nr:hypothetical protein [Clostridioides difficile]MDI3116223.1 hypothetical protein [Clostridioides difficile]SJT10959.1 Uncharacterised protein [Clostridioides difficile]